MLAAPESCCWQFPDHEDMGKLMWVDRTLTFHADRNLLKDLVAGGGFEPPTFGL